MLYSEAFDIIVEEMEKSAKKLSDGMEKGIKVQQAIGLQIEITSKTLEYLELMKEISEK